MRLIDPQRFEALKATGKLPSPKGVALSIIKLLRRDDFRVVDLVRLVQSDPAIAGRLPYFANVDAFGRQRPIVSLQRAIVALGAFRVRDLVIGLSVMLDHQRGACRSFDYEGFWSHSLATGIACQEIGHLAQIAPEEVFTVGLLARIGELSLASIFPTEYAEVIDRAAAEGTPLAELEQARFDLDHRALGATLLAEWGMPEALTQAVYHHEAPDDAGLPEGTRVQTLTLSLSFASTLGQICCGGETARWERLPTLVAYAARLGIGGEALNERVDRVAERWREWGEKLQIRTPDLPPFAELLAASPPLPGPETTREPANRRSPLPALHVQMIGLSPARLGALSQQIEALGHQPSPIEDTPQGHADALRRPAPILLIGTAFADINPADFLRRFRATPRGKESTVLFELPSAQQDRLPEYIEAGADDILVEPASSHTLRAHFNSAARLLALKDEILRERQGALRSTDAFAATQKQLLQNALTDPLTQLPNRRNGLDFLDSQLVFVPSNTAPTAFLMLDIDHFKRINDSQGHAAGDAVLRQLAALLKSRSRAEDLIFRHGGEEFGAVLPNTNRRVALQIGERIRAEVEQTPFVWETQKISVTLSVGVAVSSGSESSGQELIEAADEALYRAKEAGRNRVVAAP